MPPRDTLSLAQARRVALAAQGFADPRPAGAPSGWAVRRLFDRVGLVQIDSVNVLSRAHYLPLFSRVGPYDRALMDRGAHYAPAQALRVLGPRGLADPRRAAAASCAGGWSARTTTPGAGCAGCSEERPELVADVLDEVRERGPIAASALEAEERPQAHGPVVGLVRRQARDRVPVLERAGHVGPPARASSGSTTCPSGCCRAEVLATPTPDGGGGPAGAAARSPRARWASRASATCATTSACPRRRPRRGSRSSSRRASCTR